MAKVASPLFGTTATGRIGDIGTFRQGTSGPQFIRTPKAKKKKKKPRLPKPQNETTIWALDVAAMTGAGIRVAIYPADRVSTTRPPASIKAISQPGNGTAELYSDAVFYLPDPDFTGTDSMHYTARDADNHEATATIRIKVVKLKKKKIKPPPDPYIEWLKEQLALARKAWAKLPRKKRTISNFGMWTRTTYYREPDWPEFWRQWLIDHPFPGQP